MDNEDKLERLILAHWAARGNLFGTRRTIAEHDAGEVIDQLDDGTLRVAEPDQHEEFGWRVNDWVRKAIDLYFDLNPPDVIEGAAGDNRWDKIQPKFSRWSVPKFRDAGFRVSRGANVRRGAFLARDTLLLASSFANIGAYIDTGTVLEPGASAGSCAQIGKRVRLQGRVGNLLGTTQTRPAIIEDDCWIGPHCYVAAGIVIQRGTVLHNVVIEPGTPILSDGRTTWRRYVPMNAVVMPSVHPESNLVLPSIVSTRKEGQTAEHALEEALEMIH